MKLPTPALRWIARGSAGALLVLATGAGAQAAASTATAIRAPGAPVVGSGGPASDPYSPAFHHRYRRGVIPTRTTAARMRAWASQHPAATAVHASSASNLSYGGGIDSTGVTTGQEKVYLVFYGSQWGTQGSSGGYTTLTGDTSGEAPYLQKLFAGLGTNSEHWSGVMTQYCQGVKPGAQTCPSSAPHVAYPRGGALAGVWVDESAASPVQATPLQLGTEAVSAAAHFGNGTAASNRDAQYVILSPPGTDPDQYQQQGFCAWHDYSNDPAVNAGNAHGDIAFTNLPYITDAGASCGQSFVNSGKAGTLDGLSIVGGHEYAETLTDQNPPGGWTDSSGMENADKCAWIPAAPKTGGSAADLSLVTGTFAMQSTWANDGNGGKGACEFTHAITGTQLLANPGFESGKLTPWTATSGVLKKKSSSYPAHSGSWLARLDGRGTTHTDTLAQKVTIAPAGGTYTGASFAFWLETKTNDPAKSAYDTLKVQVLDSGGNVVRTLATYSNLNAASHYARHLFSLNAYAGQTITIKFTGTETLQHHNTSFFVDDTALNGS
jgi:serine protease